MYKRQDVDGLSILMPPKTAPKNIVESVQVPTDLPVQTECKYPLHLVIKPGHIRKAAAVDGEHLSYAVSYTHLYDTQSLAKFAFSMFWRAMRFAEEQQVPILLDY